MPWNLAREAAVVQRLGGRGYAMRRVHMGEENKLTTAHALLDVWVSHVVPAILAEEQRDCRDFLDRYTTRGVHAEVVDLGE